MARIKANPKATSEANHSTNDSDQSDAKNQERTEHCIKVRGGTKYIGPYGEIFIPDDDADEDIGDLKEETEESNVKEDALGKNDNINYDQENESMDIEDVEDNNESSWNSNDNILDEEDEETGIVKGDSEEINDQDYTGEEPDEAEDEDDNNGECSEDTEDEDVVTTEEQDYLEKVNKQANNAMEEDDNKIIVHDKLIITKVKKVKDHSLYVLPEIKAKTKATITMVKGKHKTKGNGIEDDDIAETNDQNNVSREKGKNNPNEKMDVDDSDNKRIIHNKLTITKMQIKKENDPNITKTKVKNKATITKVAVKKEKGGSSENETKTNFKEIKQEKVQIETDDIPSFEIRSDATVKMETKTESENISENYWVDVNNLNTIAKEDHDTSGDITTPLQCIPCKKTFPKNWNLKLHLTTQIHFKNSNTASKRTSSSVNNLLVGETIFSCDVCQIDFALNNQLDVHLQTKSHLRIMRGGKRYTCEVCTKGLSSKTNLRTHLKTHTGVKSYKCDECPKAFGQGIALERHKKRHAGIKDFSCTQCPKTFYEAQNLRNHMVLHTGEKPFTCEHCWKCFAHVKSWKIHTMNHAGLKPFSCSECEYTVVDKGALKKHMRKHTGVKPYTCDMCPQDFGYKESLKNHEKNHGAVNELKPFVCKQCLWCTGDERCLIKHMKLH